LTLGGGLKRAEMVSARFADILSELYLLSAVLKRWDEEGRQRADLPLVAYCMEEGFATIEARFDAIFRNFPNRPVAWWLRFVLLPFGVRCRGPSDRLTQTCAKILLAPSATRERLTVDIFHGGGEEPLARLERAFDLVIDTALLRDRMRNANIDAALAQRLITAAEAQTLRAASDAVAAAIAVDDFAPEELAPRQASDAAAADAAPLQWDQRARQTQSVAGGGA